MFAVLDLEYYINEAVWKKENIVFKKEKQKKFLKLLNYIDYYHKC